MFRQFLAAAAVTVVTLSPLAGGTARANPDVYKKALPGVAWVVTQEGKELFEATAWVVDRENRLLVTNNHVVTNASKILVFFPETKGGKVIADREWYIENAKPQRARVVVTDERRDLAVIKVPELPDGVKELKLADASPEAGDTVYSVGNPGSRPRLWVGTSSEVRRVRKTRQVFDGSVFDGTAQETVLAIHKGASGSPVLNEAGEVVGVVFGGDFRKSDDKLVLVRAYSVDVTDVRAVVDQARGPKAARKGDESGRSEAQSHSSKQSRVPVLD